MGSGVLQRRPAGRPSRLHKVEEEGRRGLTFGPQDRTGTWITDDTGFFIYWNDESKYRMTLTGMRQKFHYVGRSSSVEDGCWIMYEYSLDKSIPVHADIEATAMPEEYRYKVSILCNDCNNNGEACFHILGHKCGHCNSYNTRRLSAPDN